MKTHEKSLAWRAAFPLLMPFALLYAMVVRFKNAAYHQRLLRPARLSWPVLSVGNLSVGGTGKTPVVLLLSRLLSELGWAVDVLSRGYRRSSTATRKVDIKGAPEEFGDEPSLMARHGVAVYVGTDRYLAGKLAEQNEASTPRLHILDDGFQHRRLARAVDIVLLQRGDLKDDMLPAGRLREPLSALERTDICILRLEDADIAERVLRLMRQSDPARIWLVERRTVLPAPWSSTQKAFAFCAIGDPQGFFQGLRAAGAQLVGEIVFRDHHAYTHQDVARLKAAARRCGAKFFVTTEKDNVRLPQALRAELESESPLVIAGLEISLREEARSIALLESLIADRLQAGARNVR